MFVGFFFAICILLSIFALCLAFLHFVKKKLHCFQPIRIEKYFHVYYKYANLYVCAPTMRVEVSRHT